MRPIVLLRAAQGDLRRAARFYEGEAAGLGVDFLAEIQRIFTLLEENPAPRCTQDSGAAISLPYHLPHRG